MPTFEDYNPIHNLIPSKSGIKLFLHPQIEIKVTNENQTSCKTN